MVELQLFKDLLNFEIKRITNLCNFWEKETLDVVPEEIQGKILSVIGM